MVNKHLFLSIKYNRQVNVELHKAIFLYTIPSQNSEYVW